MNQERDTFDRFQPHERGRFGDNESADGPAADSTDVEITLYQLGSTNKALRLSPGGSESAAAWIPRRFAQQASATQYEKLHGHSVIIAIFSIAKWKAQELGWLQVNDERQESLL